jgi:hypothetical protein
MRRSLLAAAAAISFVGMAGTANAAIVIGNVQPANVGLPRPTPTFDFDLNTPPVTDGAIQTGSNASGAQPVGSTGRYYSVGPSTGGIPQDFSGEVDLWSFVAPIGSLSLIWGSVDTYNTLSFLGAGGSVLASFSGSQIINSNFGSQILPSSNPFVTFNITGADQTLIRGLRLTSTQEAFEIDNITIGAVPEPGTWALMLLGFGFVGASLRSRKDRTALRVRYAL